MDKQQAIRIIEETFKNPFNEGRFIGFIRNLFNEVDEDKSFTMAGNYIPDAYKDHIKLYKRIAKYTDPEENELDILAVNLKKETSFERARTMQRNFLAWYLKNRGQKDAALVAYYTEENEDWRFSYVRMDYRTQRNENGKVKAITEFTPARRYSFLVGLNEPNHTAQQQLVPLLQDTQNNPTLTQIEEAFNIESVTKEFFKKYRLLFDDLNDHIKKEIKKSKQLNEELSEKGIDASSFTKKLLGQIVFLYFIQKKGWLGVPKDQTWGKGDRQFLRTLLHSALIQKSNFYSDYLEFLFYEALATEHRGGSDASYYPKFDCKIPFLNGGLFEADYDWKKIEVSIPNSFFTNSNKTEEGDIGDGILDVFDRYNFTVKEDEPLEKEVAVDPEMLGKVFENLLEVKDRKSKGAFYTPREIVHFMCEESLISYLDVTLNTQPSAYSKLGEQQADAFGNKGKKGQLDIEAEVGNEIKVLRKDIENFITHGIAALENDMHVETKGKETETYSYRIPETIRRYAKEIDKALETIRICDPAIGSGAFPVGMMSEIVQARQILNTYLKLDNTTYDFKRHAIQECIYGVDIDHSAIDIAKLRLWLSLIVDEVDFYRIKPLPNLDYKIVQGNSLIGLPYVSQQMEAVEKLKEAFFNETNAQEKIILRDKINHEIFDILKRMSKQIKYEINFDFRLFFSEVFREKKGFDVVIGNPPYLESRSGEFNDELKIQLQKSTEGRWSQDAALIVRGCDLLVYFMESSINLIHHKGWVVLITQNSWLDTEYGKKFQNFLLRKTNVKSIIDSDFKYFDAQDGPNINTVVTIFEGRTPSPSNEVEFSRYHEDYSKVSLLKGDSFEERKIDIITSKRFRYNDSTLTDIKWGVLLSAAPVVLSLLNKIKNSVNREDFVNKSSIDIGQGLNLSKNFIVAGNTIDLFPFLKQALIPFFTSDDGAPFNLRQSQKYLVDRMKLQKDEIKIVEKNGINLADHKILKRSRPILIIPRGIGRHFCALNSCGAYSASFVDIYDSDQKLTEEIKLNLWLFLNSSVCWLIREISGRKNLGGGMLKAEAIDLKSIPINHDFRKGKEIKAIFHALSKREALDTLAEMESNEHKQIDDLVYGHFGIKKREADLLNENLYNLIIQRTNKSRT